ncbi:MAG TPA: PP2C family protein-serine/threonine phosphatase [Kofleriaceae bacterium]|jgi:sigma-B regulation protein RsbU (phosphoserine phosphatase)
MTRFPGLPIGQLTLDAQFRITAVDEAFIVLFEGGAELVGQSLDDLISERDRRGAVALSNRLNSFRDDIIDLALVINVAGIDTYVRLRIVRQGEEVIAYVEPSDSDNSLTYELALARQRWSALLQRSDEGIVLLSPTGRILQHNMRFFELMQFSTRHGITLAESALEGRQLATMLPRAFQTLADALTHGEDEFLLRLEIDGRTLEAEGRTLRLPLRGRIETLLLMRDLSEQKQIADRDAVIQKDLEQAAKFQTALLDQRIRMPGLGIDIAYRPLHRVGGDLFDVTRMSDGTVRLFIADATGHGVTAALSTMLIKSEYDAIKLDGEGPGATLTALNDRITRSYLKLAVMFTAAIVDISPDRRTIRHACGGHPGPVLWHDSTPIELAEGGPFLGAISKQVYPEWSASHPQWSSLLLLTDGVTEARDPEGQQFGEQRLYASVEEALQRGKKVTANVLAHLDAFTASQHQSDDITLLVVQPELS